jgi:general secretion pathway protein I
MSLCAFTSWGSQRQPRRASAAKAARKVVGGPRRHGVPQRGFTLIEVLAAIMLLGIAFTALLGVAGASTALTQNAADRSAAALWARSMLDGGFVTAPPPVGHSSGRFDDKFSWQLDVSPWADNAARNATGSMQLYQLDLEVAWGSTGRRHSTHFRTLQLVQGPRGMAEGGSP